MGDNVDPNLEALKDKLDESLGKIKDKANQIPDNDATSENSQFEELESITLEFSALQRAFTAQIQTSESSNVLKSLKIKKSLLNNLDLSLKFFVPAIALNAGLFLVIIFIFQIRLFFSSFYISNARLFEILNKYYENSKIISIGPIIIFLIFIGGWLFKKVNTKSEDDNDKGIIDKINKFK